MNEHPLKTPAAAKSLGISYLRLSSLVRYGHLTPPAKDSSGDYQWWPHDLERAREVLAMRPGRGVSRA